MKYFFDTEFIEDGKTIDLLSIGIVAEDGRELYLRNTEADLDRANPWVMSNVFPSLGVSVDGTKTGKWFTREAIVLAILEFIGDGKPEFWAYYADYDWVVLCQLFGRMIDLPKGWPMYCNDLKQRCKSMGDPELPKQDSTEHHALSDARWVKTAYLWLDALEKEKE